MYLKVYCFHSLLGPVDKDPQTTLVKASWKPSLSYVGVDGIPNIASVRLIQKNIN